MDWFKIIAAALAALSSGAIAVLHASGADRHKTIAGDVAKAVGVAASIAQATHDALSDASPSPEPAGTP